MAGNPPTLLQYLSVQPPQLTSISLSDDNKNTTNEAYSYENITHVGHWQTFRHANMWARYQNVLSTAMQHGIPPMPRYTQPVTAEIGLRSAFDVYLKERLREGLIFALADQRRPPHHEKLDFGVGKLAQCTLKFEPDTACFVPIQPHTRAGIRARVNRCPGDFKPSYKWQHSFPNHTGERFRREGRQVLSQLNKYMNDNETRYGYILTDQCFVAVRKLDRNGRLEMSENIPWRHQPNNDPNAPQWGALLALWYLCMLAAEHDQWQDNNNPPGNAHHGNHPPPPAEHKRGGGRDDRPPPPAKRKHGESRENRPMPPPVGHRRGGGRDNEPPPPTDRKRAGDREYRIPFRERRA